jgi:hypothetical protein
VVSRAVPAAAAVADAKEVAVPAIAADGERAAMAKELGSRVARRGWSAPDNFDEMIAIYADEGVLAAMLKDVWQANTLKDLLDHHHIDLPGMANN